jgi:predicted membrane protein
MEKVKGDTRLVIGIILIGMGIVFLMSSLGILNFSVGYYLFNWKTFLIFLGLVMFVNKQRKITGVVLISLGVAFWLPYLFGVNIRFSQVFFPLVLIGIGAVIVSKRTGKGVEDSEKQKNARGEFEYHGDTISDVAIFGGTNKIINSKNFKGGTLTSVFGSTELNLVNAEVSDEGCVLDVFALFGGTKLIVPPDWKIESDVVSLLGGFNDKRRLIRSEVDPSKTLLIKGMVILGGIEIKSY